VRSSSLDYDPLLLTSLDGLVPDGLSELFRSARCDRHGERHRARHPANPGIRVRPAVSPGVVLPSGSATIVPTNVATFFVN
jgi:hypothetical protein